MAAAARFSLYPSSPPPPPVITPNHHHHSTAKSGVNVARTKTKGFVVMMCAGHDDDHDHCHFSVDLQIRSSLVKKKVFEDRMAGIVCYRDENGEITCEGYDEGPRFHQQISRFGFNPAREIGLIQILERCWLKGAVGDDKNGIGNDIV